ncbi:MAG: polysaccharide biosynthesis protein [Clostridia bacterium]|nr:polysaccharide biosynthesis protein [Clostridia bacterium]
MAVSRMTHAKRNIKSAAVIKLITPITSFITRTALIYSLGSLYLGLNSLFTSMLQVLSLAELGFGSAMVFSLYKPMAEEDHVTVCALLRLYQRIYRIIGSVILGVGLILIPFLPHLINGSVPDGMNLTVLYLIRLADTSVSYFLFSYRSALLDASQQKRVFYYIHSVAKIALCVLQVTLLLLFRNYYMFCVVQPLIQIGINLAIWRVTEKKFPQYKCEGDLPKETVRDITKRVTGLFMFKVSHVLRNSFDSIILSAFLGLDILAKYQNYLLIVTTVVGITSILTDSTLSSVGNSVAMESKEKNYKNFLAFQLLFMTLVGCVCACMCGLYQPFIRFWVKEENLFPTGLMLVFVVYFFTERMGNICFQYRQASGLWWEDRIRPIVDGLTNLTLNYFLVQYIGVAGVMLSTILCQVFIDSVWGSRILFRSYFTEQKQRDYLARLLLFAGATAAACGLSMVLCGFLPESGENAVMSLVWMGLRGLVCAVCGGGVFLLVYRFLPEFGDVKRVVLKMLKRA